MQLRCNTVNTNLMIALSCLVAAPTTLATNAADQESLFTSRAIAESRAIPSPIPTAFVPTPTPSMLETIREDPTFFFPPSVDTKTPTPTLLIQEDPTFFFPPTIDTKSPTPTPTILIREDPTFFFPPTVETKTPTPTLLIQEDPTFFFPPSVETKTPTTVPFPTLSLAPSTTATPTVASSSSPTVVPVPTFSQMPSMQTETPTATSPDVFPSISPWPTMSFVKCSNGLACFNGGVCAATTNSGGKVCVCAEGYYGTYCQLESAPTDTTNSPSPTFATSPTPTWVSTLGDPTMAPALSLPHVQCENGLMCFNGGTCVADAENVFVCNCTEWYIGDTCEYAISSTTDPFPFPSVHPSPSSSIVPVSPTAPPSVVATTSAPSGGAGPRPSKSPSIGSPNASSKPAGFTTTGRPSSSPTLILATEQPSPRPSLRNSESRSSNQPSTSPSLAPSQVSSKNANLDAATAGLSATPASPTIDSTSAAASALFTPSAVGWWMSGVAFLVALVF